MSRILIVDRDPLERLIQSADEALYQAKNAGKSREETSQLDLLSHV